MTQQFEQYPETYIHLLEYIKAFASENVTNRLPSEEKLATLLGVSRIKIRDVLSELEAVGYVIRKRGVGTMINRIVLNEHARLDMDTVYVDTIAAYGHTPKVSLNSVRLLNMVSVDVQHHLHLNNGESVYMFEKCAYADDIPVVYTIDYIPAKYYDNKNLDLAMMDSNIFYFLQGLSDDMLETLMVHMDAVIAAGNLSKIMQLPEGSPLLQLNSVCYTQMVNPVMYSVEYFNTKIIPFSFQKRIMRGKFNPTQPPKVL